MFLFFNYLSYCYDFYKGSSSCGMFFSNKKFQNVTFSKLFGTSHVLIHFMILEFATLFSIILLKLINGLNRVIFKNSHIKYLIAMTVIFMYNNGEHFGLGG